MQFRECTSSLPLRKISLLSIIMTVALSLSALSQTFQVDSGATLNVGTVSQGMSWIDFDSDSDLDIMLTTGVFASPIANLSFKNNGSGVYSLFSSTPLTTDLTLTAGQAWGDYNNDGRPDLFVCNHTSANTLYRNLGSSFDKPSLGHLNATTGFHYSADWGDFDNDGFLDLVVCPRNVTGPVTGGVLLLYRNTGVSGLVRITTGSLATTMKNYAYARWIDYDSDGDLDLFATCGAPVATENDILFRNQLIETETADFVIEPSSGLTSDASDGLFPAWGDYDNDGDADLYVTTWDGFGSPTPNRLYQNNGDGTFTQLTGALVGSIITGSFVSTGATWGDFDNDGDLDLFTTEQTSANNRLHRNNGDGSFTDVTVASSFIPVSGYTSHAASWADDDRDGDLDLYVTYAYGPPNARNRIYRNSGTANHWLTIKLEGYEGNNRSGIGAKIHLLVDAGGGSEWQRRDVSSQSGFFSTTLEQHFGLGSATVADSVIVEWPSGLRSTFANIPAVQLIVLNDCVNLDADTVVCLDNCPSIPNNDQADNNADGIGNACCCLAARGNVDGDPGDGVDIGDLTQLVDHLFISFVTLPCPNEADVDASTSIDIADLTVLVDHLFITFQPISGC